MENEDIRNIIRRNTCETNQGTLIVDVEHLIKKLTERKTMENEIETLDCYPVEFNNLHKQDNPAYGDVECLMIVKECEGDKAIVLHIQPVEKPLEDESVTQLAIFWKHTRAIEYCELLGLPKAD